MSPIVEIENTKYNNLLIFNDNNEEKIMSSKTLFDVKFNGLKNYFIIRDTNSVYEFIKNNENIFNLLEKVKSSLNKHFNNERYFLEVRCYPEIYEPELALIIKADYSQNLHGLNKKLTAVNLDINDYKIELGLLGKFFITMEGL